MRSKEGKKWRKKDGQRRKEGTRRKIEKTRTEEEEGGPLIKTKRQGKKKVKERHKRERGNDTKERERVRQLKKGG